RLHNKANLQNELKKILKVCGNAKEGAPHKKIIVLDGTQGNSAIAQAKIFNETIGLDGAIITKLDGTSKGGALFSIVHELRMPILYIGVGEKEGDLIEFNHSEYINTLLDSIYE
ncbi:MAG: signal recognition particle-docking protein FtsY, partial [Campylobacterales bacterium]